MIRERLGSIQLTCSKILMIWQKIAGHKRPKSFVKFGVVRMCYDSPNIEERFVRVYVSQCKGDKRWWYYL